MQTTHLPRIVVLISGKGSNLQSFIDAIQMRVIDAEIVAVISNNPGVLGLERAEKHGIPTQVVNHRDFPEREDFDAALAEVVESYRPNLILLAGFMRILTPDFVEKFKGRMMNIHPSLLPKYPGLHTHQRAIDAGDTVAGATVHFVTSELDGGPAIIQAQVPIEAGDDAETLGARVFEQEHMIYPMAVRWFCQGRLGLINDRACMFGRPLPPTGHPFSTVARER
ncbi:phosphoribosylglycinamide formyltransferase [Porticoccus sp.]